MAENFELSQSLVDKIVAFLDSKSEVLSETQPEGVGSSFGGAPSSRGCASDAGKAREHVRTAVTDMAAGLDQYRTSIDDMRRRARAAEDAAEVAFRQQLDAAQACQAPTFAAPTQCTVPGSSNEEG